MSNEVKVNKATVQQLLQFANQHGIDTTDIMGGDKRGVRMKLIGVIRESQLTKDDMLSLDEEPTPVKEKPTPALKLTPAKSANEARRQISDEHREAMKTDPRNPFPGRYVGDMIKILIQKQDPKFYPGGDQPVPVTVNGSTMLIPRGKVCEVPYEYALVLEHAKSTIYENDEINGLQKVGEAHQFPFQVYG